MELHVIISVESFGKVQNAEKTILVKANKVEEVFVNDFPLGYSFSKEESEDTDWFIFEDTEVNRDMIMYWVRNCEKDKFWGGTGYAIFQNVIEYYDVTEKMVKRRRVYLAPTGNFDKMIFWSEEVNKNGDINSMATANLPV